MSCHMYPSSIQRRREQEFSRLRLELRLILPLTDSRYRFHVENHHLLLLHANKHGYPGSNQEDVHHNYTPQHPPFTLMERLPFGSEGKHCDTTQAPKPPVNLDDSGCGKHFWPFALDFQQHPVSRKCVYPHGT